MSDKIPLHPDNKVYTFKDLKPKFITNIQDYFRKLKLKRYKKRKVKQSKTPHQRNFYMKFRLNIDDDVNPQIGARQYTIVVPAKAAFFAKLGLERSIIKKIKVEVLDWEEITDEENNIYNESKKEFIYKTITSKD